MVGNQQLVEIGALKRRRIRSEERAYVLMVLLVVIPPWPRRVRRHIDADVESPTIAVDPRVREKVARLRSILAAAPGGFAGDVPRRID
jgi:hypothetical protein